MFSSMSPRAVNSLQAAILFFIVANPVTYRFVQAIFGCFFKVANSSTGCPTMLGLMLHALVFGLISYVLMSMRLPVITVLADKAKEVGQVTMGTAEDIVQDVPEDIIEAEKAMGSEVMLREGFMSRRKREGYGTCGLKM
jgi:hypothetical protein